MKLQAVLEIHITRLDKIGSIRVIVDFLKAVRPLNVRGICQVLKTLGEHKTGLWGFGFWKIF